MEFILKNTRGKLIQIIINEFIENNLYKNPDTLKNQLQEILDGNLDFESKVGEVENINNKINFDVYYEDESDKDTFRAINSTIEHTVNI